MSIADAVLAREMATRNKRSIPVVLKTFGQISALLGIAIEKGHIDWGGYGNEVEWYYRKKPTKTSWGGGELGIRTFEEINPAQRAHIPYKWIEQTYGVSEKSIEQNRNAGGDNKVYDILKESQITAQIAFYDGVKDMIYQDADSSIVPAGLLSVIGDAYEPVSGTNTQISVDAGKSYAGLTLNTSAISSYAINKETMGWDNEEWAPTVLHEDEIGQTAGGAADPHAWSTYAVATMDYMANAMQYAPDVSGTGRPMKPPLALMESARFNALRRLLSAGQIYNIPLGRTDAGLNNWSNIQVNSLTAIRDDSIPQPSVIAATGGFVFFVAEDEFKLCTTHKKSEGLIKSEFDAENILARGAIGVFKGNMCTRWSSPCAVGAVIVS